MAFTSLAESLIAVGKPLVRSILNTLRTNQNDLDTRVTSVESAFSKVVIYDGTINSSLTYATATGLIFHRVQSAIDLTDAKVILFDKNGVSSGTVSIDIQKASATNDFSSSVTVFSTQPSLDLSVASNFTESSNAVFTAAKTLAEGDWLRIDISSNPTGLQNFGIYIIGEPS